MRVAFAGLRHGHIYTLYEMMKCHKDFEVVGGYEENEEARKLAIEKGLSCHYQSMDELFSDEKVDVVALGGCYGERGALAIRALTVGKHVIADKPLCTSLEELDKIEELAKKNNRVVSCMYTMRFEPKINAVRKMIQEGVLGEINNVYFGGQHPLMYGRRPMWYFEKDKHGGVINDIAIHGIDALDYMCGLKLDVINASRCWNKYAMREREFKDSAQFMLTMKNGAGVLADVSYAIPDGVEFALPYYWQFYIWGTKGTMRFSISETTLSVDIGDAVDTKNIVYYSQGSQEAKLYPVEEMHSDYLTDFINMVEKSQDVILPMQDVINSARATLAIQQRADTMAK